MPLLQEVEIPAGPDAAAAVSGIPATPVDVGKDPAHAATACVLQPGCAGISAAVSAADAAPCI